MKYFKNILAISSLFCIMFIPTFGATYGQDCHDCAIVAGLEIVDELEYYTLDDSMTVRGKTPTTEPLDIILEIIHFESGDILKTFETKSSNSRYLIKII